jgi:hypothetical protein
MFAHLRQLTVDAYSFYSARPAHRAVEIHPQGHTCLYVTAAGKLCAIGKMLTPEELRLLALYGLNGMKVAVLATHPCFEGLGIADYPVDFLADLQALHDTHDFWDLSGPTKAGDLHFRAMMQKIHFKRYEME